MEKQACVYLLTNQPHGTIYIGVTSNLKQRVWQHKEKLAAGFPDKYDLDELVWCELHNSMAGAIAREKNLKNWKREWKIALILRSNPDWHDLYKGLF